MRDVPPGRSAIRKLWVGDNDRYRDHLLRLDPVSRHWRFGGAVSDRHVHDYAARTSWLGAVLHGFQVEGTLRGVGELRSMPQPHAYEAEVAFSIEQPWQSNGVGSALMARILLSARNRGVRFLHMICRADNERMQHLARKFDAELSFEYGDVIGEVIAPGPTVLSVTREMVADYSTVADRMFEMQTRLLGRRHAASG